MTIHNILPKTIQTLFMYSNKYSFSISVADWTNSIVRSLQNAFILLHFLGI